MAAQLRWPVDPVESPPAVLSALHQARLVRRVPVGLFQCCLGRPAADQAAHSVCRVVLRQADLVVPLVYVSAPAVLETAVMFHWLQGQLQTPQGLVVHYLLPVVAVVHEAVTCR